MLRREPSDAEVSDDFTKARAPVKEYDIDTPVSIAPAPIEGPYKHVGPSDSAPPPPQLVDFDEFESKAT